MINATSQYAGNECANCKQFPIYLKNFCSVSF